MQEVTICGGGNAAHMLLGVLLSRLPSNNISMYLPLEEEFMRFRDVLAEPGEFEVWQCDSVQRLGMSGVKITNEPSDIGTSDIVFVAVPAFAHRTILSQILAYLQNDATIVFLPARGGLEYELAQCCGNQKSHPRIVGLQTLPWACRTREFGCSVNLLSTKRQVGAACIPNDTTGQMLWKLSWLLGLRLIPYSSMLEITLANAGQILHPGIMCSEFYPNRHQVFASNSDVPLFYCSISSETGDILSRMSDEIISIKSKIEAESLAQLDNVVHLSDWLLKSYAEEIADRTTVTAMLRTNRAYRTVKAPVTEQCKELVIDRNSRYLTEDLPFGLLVTRGIAGLAKVDTPAIDEVIGNACEWLSTAYVREGRVSTSADSDSRTPQRFGINSLEELIKVSC